MIDRWLGSLTFKQNLIVLFASLAMIGVLIGVIVLLIGCGWIAALIAGVVAIGTILLACIVRLAFKVWQKLRSEEE